MLSCDEALNLLSAYYDGELGVAASNQVKEHLCSCEECSRVLEDMAVLSGAFSKLDFPKIDDAFTKSLHEKLEAKATRPKKYYKIMHAVRPYVAVAASLAIVIGIYAVVDKRDIGTSGEIPAGVRHLDMASSAADNVSLEEEIANKAEENITAPTPSKQRTMTNNINKTIHDDKKTVTAAEENNKESIVQQEIKIEEPQAVHAYESYDEEDGISPASYNTDIKAEADAETEDENGEIAEQEIRLVHTRFKLLDTEQKENVISILERYGAPLISETNIKMQLLAANYNACIEVLQGVEGLDKHEDVPVDDGEGYCYIDIELQ